MNAAVKLSQLISQCKLSKLDCMFIMGHITKTLHNVKDICTPSGKYIIHNT